MARKPQGHFLGIPYNWRRPTLVQLGHDLWDPKERRVFPPRSFGWGWGFNFAALIRRLTRR